jgi:small nuclear ribonucleoprotein G
MAPKFQKGPDLKRFMVRHSLFLWWNMLLHELTLAVVVMRLGLMVPCLTILLYGAFKIKKDKRLKISLNGKRNIIGTLRGYDAFLNVVLEQVEDAKTGQYFGQVVIRGNSIIQFEAIERIHVATTTTAIMNPSTDPTMTAMAD